MKKNFLTAALVSALMGFTSVSAMAAEAAPAQAPAPAVRPMPPCMVNGAPAPRMGRMGGAMTSEALERMSPTIAAYLLIAPNQKSAFDAWIGAQKQIADHRAENRQAMVKLTDYQDRVEQRAKHAKIHAEDLGRYASARAALLKTMSAEQKAALDQFDFAHRMGRHHGRRGGVGMMGPGCAFAGQPGAMPGRGFAHHPGSQQGRRAAAGMPCPYAQAQAPAAK